MAGAVARAVRVVRESGLPHETTAMFTTIEGEWDEVMAVVVKEAKKRREAADAYVGAGRTECASSDSEGRTASGSGSEVSSNSSTVPPFFAGCAKLV